MTIKPNFSFRGKLVRRGGDVLLGCFFSVFGLISSGGEQVVGIVVYQSTLCLEKLSGLFSVVNTED